MKLIKGEYIAVFAVGCRLMPQSVGYCCGGETLSSNQRYRVSAFQYHVVNKSNFMYALKLIYLLIGKTNAASQPCFYAVKRSKFLTIFYKSIICIDILGKKNCFSLITFFFSFECNALHHTP